MSTSDDKDICRLCESRDLSVVCTRLKGGIDGSVLRCNECGLVFLEARFFDPERIAALYQGAYHYVPSLDELIGTRYDPYLMKVERIAAHLDSRSTTVLELGAGSGQFVRALTGRVRRIVCQEFNDSQAEYLRRSYGIEVHSEGLEDMNLDEQFDVVAFLHVLEHVPDPVPFLRDALRFVKPGGILYIEVPNVRDPLLSLFDVAGYDQAYYRQPHLFYYDQYTLRRMLEKAGLKHISIQLAQNYSLTNHLHWVDVATPQANLNVGFRANFAKAPLGSPELLRDLTAVLDDADARYREALIRHGFSDAVYAIVTNRN